MNVYDFDKTIYYDDSATDFYLFSLKKDPKLALKLPNLAYNYLKFKKGKITRTELKEVLYQYLPTIDNLDERVKEFWAAHDHKIKQWYLDQKRDDDLIISASPEFLIAPICQQLNLNFMASRLDPKTGRYYGKNCYGEEKVRRYYEVYNENLIDEFYSDHLSDTPLAKMANKAFLVIDDKREPWPNI